MFSSKVLNDCTLLVECFEVVVVYVINIVGDNIEQCIVGRTTEYGIYVPVGIVALQFSVFNPDNTVHIGKDFKQTPFNIFLSQRLVSVGVHSDTRL